jgi:PhoH-like ATPase
MHDPTSLFRFEEHDIFVPIMTLEELDNNKKGMTEVARNARQVSRLLDEIVSGAEDSIAQGHSAGDRIERSGERPSAAADRSDRRRAADRPADRQGGQPDHCGGDASVRTAPGPRSDPGVEGHQHAHQGACARAAAQDYFNDKVLEDTDMLYTGTRELPEKFWDEHGGNLESWKENGRTMYRVKGPLCPDLLINEFVYRETGAKQDKPFHALVSERSGKTAVLQTLIDFGHHKNSVWGILARNREQNFALNLLMDPEIDFVTLLGQAGTGKTLLTLAAGLTQVLETKLYSEIIMTRVTVPVGEDIGFLPGTEEEKMTPWMGALEDNLDVLNKTDDPNGSANGAAPQRST